MTHDTLRLALKALLNAQQLEHLVDRQLQREAIEEVRAELWRIDSTLDSDEDIGYSIRFHYEDPRYVSVVVSGKHNYALDFDPTTGTIGTTRRCICGAWAEDTCVCDLGFEED